MIALPKYQSLADIYVNIIMDDSGNP